jgi:hypothetical protein
MLSQVRRIWRWAQQPSPWCQVALPSLPDWGAAHSIFNPVVGQWLKASLTVVIAEGPGSKAEVDALIIAIPPQTRVVLAVLTSSFEIAFERTRADPTRGISRKRAFLSDVFRRWAEEMPQMEHDVLIDSGASSVEESVNVLLDRVHEERKTANIVVDRPPDPGGGTLRRERCESELACGFPYQLRDELLVGR